MDITLCSWYCKRLHRYYEHNYGCVDTHYIVICRMRVHKNMNVSQLLSHPLLKLYVDGLLGFCALW